MDKWISKYEGKKKEIGPLPQSDRQKVNSSVMKDKTIKTLACRRMSS